jgi:hypothetical protein
MSKSEMWSDYVDEAEEVPNSGILMFLHRLARTNVSDG